jgi:hypothetical protein
MFYTFLNDLEKLMPVGSTIDKVVANEGTVTFNVVNASKEAVADTYVRIRDLDYVTDVEIRTINEVDDKLEIVNGEIVLDEEEAILLESYPYNYTLWEDRYTITVTLRDPNYLIGTVNVDVSSDDSSETQNNNNSDGEVLE